MDRMNESRKTKVIYKTNVEGNIQKGLARNTLIKSKYVIKKNKMHGKENKTRDDCQDHQKWKSLAIPIGIQWYVSSIILILSTIHLMLDIPCWANMD